jgi:hypothetical protein
VLAVGGALISAIFGGGPDIDELRQEQLMGELKEIQEMQQKMLTVPPLL